MSDRASERRKKHGGGMQCTADGVCECGRAQKNRVDGTGRRRARQEGRADTLLELSGTAAAFPSQSLRPPARLGADIEACAPLGLDEDAAICRAAAEESSTWLLCMDGSGAANTPPLVRLRGSKRRVSAFPSAGAGIPEPSRD